VRAAFANEADKSAKVERAIRTAAKLDWSHVAASFFDLYEGFTRVSKKRAWQPRTSIPN
jgi:hypothetical protein